jgi:fumarylacetoacetase
VASAADDAPGTWVPGADGSGFGIENLPYGVVRVGADAPRPAVRVGDFAVLLAALAEAGQLDGLGIRDEAFRAPTLNPLIEAGPDAWQALRARLGALLSGDSPSPVPQRGVVALADAAVELPVAVGDYVDFYSSLEHATNIATIWRPEAPALEPNWRRLPVGYHGRAATVVVSGTRIARPSGQLPPSEPGGDSTFGPERSLDFELELGFITGDGPPLGSPIPARDAARHIFGFVLVNDWSARQIQRFEYRPLGPFLGKSFATSISAWVVPPAALAPHVVPARPQEPPPLEYLRLDQRAIVDVSLEAALTPPNGSAETVLTRTNSSFLYWTPEQQLAHATVNGARVRAGDLWASGTISGPGAESYGSMLELSWGGRSPIALADGGQRTFLEDGDTVVMRGVAHGGGRPPVSLGHVSGQVIAAAPPR